MMIFLVVLIFSYIPNLSLSIPILLFDLSHTITPTIPFFPSQTRFNFTQRLIQWVDEKNSYFYSTNTFITSEHMGTHIDAPYHFSPTGWKVDEIPLKHLMSVHARIIDVSKQCKKNKNYLITIADVKANNLIVPEIDEDTREKFLFTLIFYTGWTKYWPDQTSYANGESDVQFPGVSEELAVYLMNTYGDNLVGLGIDTLSIDYGQTKTYPVHQILAKNNKYALENLALIDSFIANVDKDFFILDISPMKIGNGTGAPSRIIARIDESKNTTNWFFVLVIVFIIFLVAFVVKIIYDVKYNPNKEF